MEAPRTNLEQMLAQIQRGGSSAVTEHAEEALGAPVVRLVRIHCQKGVHAEWVVYIRGSSNWLDLEFTKVPLLLLVHWHFLRPSRPPLPRDKALVTTSDLIALRSLQLCAAFRAPSPPRQSLSLLPQPAAGSVASRKAINRASPSSSHLLTPSSIVGSLEKLIAPSSGSEIHDAARGDKRVSDASQDMMAGPSKRMRETAYAVATRSTGKPLGLVNNLDTVSLFKRTWNHSKNS